MENTQLNCTCPEDCLRSHWVYKNELVKYMVFNCSTKPRITQSVKECLIDFDVNKHPNRRLLPKNKCGKQVVTGENNSVTYYGIGPCTLYIQAV